MLLNKIENNLKTIEKSINQDNFIYDFLEAYDQPKSTIKRLKDGVYNISKKKNEVIWKKKIYFYHVAENEDVHDIIDELSKSDLIEKNKIRFLIVTDFKDFLSLDIKTKSTLDIEIDELSKNTDFFLPLAGLEKINTQNENEADIKAAEKMGKLYDILVKDNEKLLVNKREQHGFNIFFTRIIFCFFSEDSDIFPKKLFTDSIASHTSKDGKDVNKYLKDLFDVLKKKNREESPEYLKKFPYVNGGLFQNDYEIPIFSKESRKILIESGELDWSSINPDILGSMMQAVVDSGERQELGMHYTSVQNILKVIKPLFLNEIYDEIDIANDNEKKLKNILNKIYNLKIFDPACGSGNFLVISFKELSKIEIEIFKKLNELDKNDWLIVKSGIQLTQFYGIEKDDYAHEAAKLALWIAQHQMNVLFKNIFFETRPTLPLSPSGNVVCGNATLLDWNTICPIEKNKNVYLIGNPPYVGSSMQNKFQKKDMENVFKDIKGFKNLDYISCWFLLASKYIKKTNSEISFVSTNSITQGEQVSALWSHILKLGVEIGFAYKSFRWANFAKNNAGVTCVIINLRNKSNKDKYLYENETIKKVKNINPYLINTNSNIMVSRVSKHNDLPPMVKGNMPTDDGNFIFDNDQKNRLISKEQNIKKFIKIYIGAQSFINGDRRWCLWINEENKNEALKIESIKKIVEKVKNFRLNSRAPSTREYASKSYKFRQVQHEPAKALFVPSVSSESRFYIPFGFFDSDCVLNNSGYAIYKCPLYVFSILSSRMHMVWIKTVGGRLETRYRYSSDFCYNAFPFPKINNDQKNLLNDLALNILDEREKYTEKTIGEMYNTSTMPTSLLILHEKLDKIIDLLYRKKDFISDDERLEFLFNMYEDKLNQNKLI
ncbi:MAG: class I SAM-dependent DNA methyltransferase [Pelagibacterales bacterium]|nr:class I SAM-dependent DNA methyltransferase [Pelagibacterales bacterium]